MEKNRDDLLAALREANRLMENAQDDIGVVAEALRDAMIAAAKVQTEPSSPIVRHSSDKRRESIRVKSADGPETTLTVRVTSAGFVVVSVCEDADDMDNDIIFTAEEVRDLVPMLNRALLTPRPEPSLFEPF